MGASRIMQSATVIGTTWPRMIFVQGEERRELLAQGPLFSVGRKPEKDLSLLNPRVSRDHAQIVYEAGSYVLQDQESKHGTYVNGERVTRHRLQGNDRIEFGVRGEGYLLFDPDSSGASTARDFLSQIAERRPPSSVSDLEMLTLFVEAARKLNTGGVLGDVLITLLDTLLKLTRSERAYVFVRNADGGFQLAAGRNEKGEPLNDDSTISHSILQDAVSSGSEFLLTDVADFGQLANRQSVVAQQLRTVICIPLRGVNIQATAEEAPKQNEIRTILYLDSRRVGGKLTGVSAEILRAVASEAATLIENARLVQSEQAARRYQQELAIAASIQQRLMAVDIPKTPFARVAARSIPCTEIGGDFFDVIFTGEKLSLVVADVCGKGVSAALLASIIQGMLYLHLMQGRDLAEGVGAVNRFLCERNLGEKYATLLVARIAADGELEYINCGHVPPLLISASGATQLTNSNMPVGMFPEAQYELGHARCQPGERVLIVTDGVTEAENQAGDFFTYERLQSTVASLPGLPALLESVTRFCQGVPLRDDCTAVEMVYGA
jgi:serine phosphatase RsbU (regulator of sigma subunit)